MTNKIAEFNTNMGNFKAELYNEKAPITVRNFVKLTEKGFYNGLIFHRVIPNFKFQILWCVHEMTIFRDEMRFYPGRR